MDHEIEAYIAKLLKDTKAAGRKVYFEQSNVTLHGDDAFDALFGWGDHQWVKDALKK